jgi:SAM-dependent methyltransferase
MDVKEEEILGPEIGDHWYYESKGRALRTILDGKTVDEVLDVGAGSGVFTRQLIEFGLVRRGVCLDSAYDVERIETHIGCEISFVRSVDEVPQELVLMMDVLEHVDDDVGLLSEYADKMLPGGRVLISVPAFQFLWSGHDVFLEHKRRYTLSHIEQVARQAGLRVLTGRYFFGALFPLVAAIRLRGRLQLKADKIEAKSSLKRAHPLTNKILIAIHDIERVTLFPVNRLIGLTAFCLAVRD